VLSGPKGPRTEDLLLKDVRVVDGFHVNIVSQSRLRAIGLWFLGLDNSLRYGLLTNNLVMANLRTEFNLVFIEYNKICSYPATYMIMQASSLYKTKLREDYEHLWHQRLGHIG